MTKNHLLFIDNESIKDVPFRFIKKEILRFIDVPSNAILHTHSPKKLIINAFVPNWDDLKQLVNDVAFIKKVSTQIILDKNPLHIIHSSAHLHFLINYWMKHKDEKISLKIEVNKNDGYYPMSSNEILQYTVQNLNPILPNATVNLKHPNITIGVTISADELLFFIE